MKQEAVITVFGIGFSSYCEKLITDTFESNSRKVRDYFMFFFDKHIINQNDIYSKSKETYLPRVQHPMFQSTYFSLQGREAMEHVIGVINQEIQDLAAGIEQATTKLNTELEHATAVINSELNDIAQGAKNGFEQAARLNTAFCEPSAS